MATTDNRAKVPAVDFRPHCPHCDSTDGFVAVNLITGKAISLPRDWDEGVNLIVGCCAKCGKVVPTAVFCVH